MRSTLLLIAAFVSVMLASFIWFVATWDKDAEAPIGMSAEPQEVFV